MGAQQSTGGGGARPTASVEVKTSYYELLGIERDATDDEIKKAYRRKALELHPDRNYGDVERTTALFADIQTAYQVLSDSQERAWYDSHENDILRGGAGEGGGEESYDHNMRVTTANDISLMLGKFRGKVEFSDAPNGFFGYVRDIFEQLAKEEENAADWQGEDIPEYPTFGHKDDTYEDVVKEFYTAWSGFSTKKSYAWKDEHRLSEAPDRRIRRLMEKENQKLREAGIREFNDAVRALLLFVRKRDPRYTPNTQNADDRAKAQRAATKEQAAKARAAREAQMHQAVPDWATRRDADDEVEEEEEETVQELHECVACNKTFKSDKQYDAHARSKKHQKAVFVLRKKMQKDNAHLNLGSDAKHTTTFTPMEDEDEEDYEEPGNYVEDTDDVAEAVKNLNIDDNTDEEDSYDSGGTEKRKTKAKPSAVSSPEIASDDDDEYASRSEVESRIAGSSTAPSTLDTENIDDSSTANVPDTSIPKLGAAAQKRAKRAAKQAAEQAELEKVHGDLDHKCMVCNAVFPSKTQLFTHIKDVGHAALKSDVKSATKKKGKRK